MATPEKRLLQWLRDAHAMEQQAERMLSGVSRRIEHFPELKVRLEQHLEETRKQAEMVRSCIERRDGSTSTVKDTAGKFIGLGQALSGLFVGDEVVKGALASYTFEHMEIASYKILAATAEEAGDSETKRICEEILQQEEAMAEWLKQNLGSITHSFIVRDDTAGVTAKR